MLRRRRLLLAAGASLPLAWLAGCSKQEKLASRPLAAGETILCVGDSLTFGVGASAGADYPSMLAQLTGMPTVNAGVSGDTSAGVLRRIGPLLQAHAPALVLLGIGGNDFLRKTPLEATRAALEELVQVVTQSSQMVLIAEPNPSLAAAVISSLSDHPVYEEVARARSVPLYANGWSKVLSDGSLRSDPIHANDAGYRLFAQNLAEWLVKSGFLAG